MSPATEQPPLALRARAAIQRRALRSLFDSARVVGWLGRKRRDRVDGRQLDPHLAALLALDDLVGSSPLSRITPSTARRLMVEQILSVDETPPSGVRTRDSTFPTPGGRERARLYVPADIESPSPAVVYVHGGGFVTGGIGTHDGLCRRLATSARVRVVSLEYRLAPEQRFPAAVEDGLAGLRWTLTHAGELDIDPKRVAVAGDSAGGNLSAVLALRTRDDELRPALAVLLYAVTDATCSFPSHASMGSDYFLTRENIEWYLDHYLADADRKHPDISPLFANNLRNSPRTLVYTAGFDPLRDEARAYADALERAGNSVTYEEFPSLVHGFLLMGGAVPAARAATEVIFSRIQRELGA